MSRHFITTLTKFVAALLLIGISLPPQSSARGFQTGPPEYAVGLGPAFVTTADLRGLSRQDIIVGNSNVNNGVGPSTTISVLLSNGDGTYQAAVPYTVGNNPIGIAVGKFTNSGHLDLAVANGTSNTVSILLGNGDGTFQAQTTINVGANPVGVFAADLNKDGKLDLVVTNSDLFGGDSCASSSISILFGNGNGTFTAQTPVHAGLCPLDAAIVSLRKNGTLDLVVVNNGGMNSTTTSNLSVLLGVGDGTFQTAVNYGVGSRPDFVTVADFNKDGKLDLAVSDNGAKNSGANGGISLLLGNGDGTFQGATFIANVTRAEGLVSGDFNGDGNADLAIHNNTTDSYFVVLGKGDGTFQSPKNIALANGQFGLAAADLNGDGKLDLVVPLDFSPNPGAVALLLGNGDGTFRGVINTISFNGSPQSIVSANINNDPNPDLVVGLTTFSNCNPNCTEASSVEPLTGNGDGTFSPLPTINLFNNAGATGVATGSFKNNNKQDIVVSQNSSLGNGFLSYIAGNGDGTFQAPANTTFGNMNPFQITAADFNNDGKLDFVLGNCGALAVFFGNGGGSFTLNNQYNNGSNCDPGQVAVGDLNGDGFPDMVVTDSDQPGNTGNFNVYVFLNNGSGGFTGPAVYHLGPSPGSIAGAGLVLGHFKESTSAGHNDIAATNPATNTVTILTNNGNGTFTVGNSYAVGANPVYIATGNFDGTGHVDLAVANCTNCNMGSGAGSTVNVLYGNGDGTFTLDPINYVAGAGSVAIAANDFNGDGAPDLAVANSDGSTVAILLNTGGTRINLTSSLNPANFGQSVTFTATVTASVTPGTPTGTVTFMDGATTLGTGALSGNQATFMTSSLSGGTHTITAVYGGDTNFNPHTSAAVSQVVNGGTSTTTSVGSSLNPSVYGQSVTFTATVTPSAGGPPTGTVTFKDGTTTLGPGTLNSANPPLATFSIFNLTGGSHSITAVYGGDTTFGGSTSAVLTQTVNRASPTVAVSSSVNPSVYGQSVTFTATLTAPGGGTPTGTVTFKDGAATLGTGNLNAGTPDVATFLTTSPLALGSHSITAVYNSDMNFSANTSPALSQTVTQATTTTAVSSSLNPSVYGQSVQFTATVTPSAGGIPSGTVTFMDGASVLGTGTLNNLATDQATFTTTSFLTVGSHSITAVYGGDTNFAGSTSPALTQTVNKAATTTAVSSSLNPSTFGNSVTFTATVTPAAGGTPSGTVTFMDGASVLGTGTLNNATPDQATFTTATLAIGNHSITAVYGGDANFTGSTSPVLPQTVNNPVRTPTTTALTASVSPVHAGQAANTVLFRQTVTFTATVSPAIGPSGTITFMDGAATLATVTLNGAGQATFSTNNLRIGLHPIVANYSGDFNYLPSSSSTLNEYRAPRPR